jgi:hypothetical protein
MGALEDRVDSRLFLLADADADDVVYSATAFALDRGIVVKSMLHGLDLVQFELAEEQDVVHDEKTKKGTLQMATVDDEFELDDELEDEDDDLEDVELDDDGDDLEDEDDDDDDELDDLEDDEDEPEEEVEEEEDEPEEEAAPAAKVSGKVYSRDQLEKASSTPEGKEKVLNLATKYGFARGRGAKLSYAINTILQATGVETAEEAPKAVRSAKPKTVKSASAKSASVPKSAAKAEVSGSREMLVEAVLLSLDAAECAIQAAKQLLS